VLGPEKASLDSAVRMRWRFLPVSGGSVTAPRRAQLRGVRTPKGRHPVARAGAQREDDRLGFGAATARERLKCVATTAARLPPIGRLTVASMQSQLKSKGGEIRPADHVPV
jgi:hypothetical protein